MNERPKSGTLIMPLSDRFWVISTHGSRHSELPFAVCAMATFLHRTNLLAAADCSSYRQVMKDTDCVSPDSYAINLSLAVTGLGLFVVFDSVPSVDVTFRKIVGREVFLFDTAGLPLWQISPEPGTTEGRSHEFDRAIVSDEPFVNVWEAGGRYYASRFSGDTFVIDTTTGAAVYTGWART